MDTTSTVSIEDLPPEVIEIVATYLSGDDLESCSDVSENWRKILNSNKLWKKHCVYPEKYFKTSGYESGEKTNCDNSCTWKKNFKRQKLLWENWSKGQFTVNEADINASSVCYLVYFVDELGNYWLLYSEYDCGITVWKISEVPVFHCKLDQTDQFGILPVKSKLFSYVSNYIKVFEFMSPENELKLQYRFIFDKNTVISDNSDFHYEYVCCQRFIIVDNFLIGYCENVTDLCETFVHIWDCDSGRKVARQSIFQQSFVNYVLSMTGNDIIKDFEGGLVLFDSDSRRFLVNVIDDKYKLCQISLFSLDKMEIVNVVAQLESRSACCFMKGDVIVIHHKRDKNQTSQVSVYNDHGKLLAYLDYSHSRSLQMNNEFWLTSSKVILKVQDGICVLDIVKSESVCERRFNTDTKQFILGFVDPKFLLLYEKVGIAIGCQRETVAVSVWDLESGSKLWNLGKIDTLDTCNMMFSHSVYPSKLIVHFTGDEQLSILNFETVHHNVPLTLEQ
uniref:F-box domain-containing protein n=1 Tax=Graphocephala atropunctata TaxID=36148 RepID=A0A1B6L6T1_9HEMI